MDANGGGGNDKGVSCFFSNILFGNLTNLELYTEEINCSANYRSGFQFLELVAAKESAFLDKRLGLSFPLGWGWSRFRLKGFPTTCFPFHRLWTTFNAATGTSTAKRLSSAYPDFLWGRSGANLLVPAVATDTDAAVNKDGSQDDNDENADNGKTCG